MIFNEEIYWRIYGDNSMFRDEKCGTHQELICIFMVESRSHKMLHNLNNLPELGRKCFFELGNSFYFKNVEDRNEPCTKNARICGHF